MQLKIRLSISQMKRPEFPKLKMSNTANWLFISPSKYVYVNIYFFSIFTSCLLQCTNAMIICIQTILFKCKFYYIICNVVTVAFANQCTYTCRYNIINEVLPIFFIQICYLRILCYRNFVKFVI